MFERLIEEGIFFQAGTIFSSPIFTNIIFPFVLIFTIVFAVLQKYAILGKGKRQIDALVSLVIGLIFISFANAVGIVNTLIPFLAVSLVIILVFLLLFSMAFQGEKKFELGKGIQMAIGALVALGVVITVLIATGAWDYLKINLFNGSETSGVLANVIFVVAVLVALGVAVFGKGSSD